MRKTAQQIRNEILQITNNFDEYEEAEQYILQELSDKEIAEYNLYMARVTGLI